MQIQPRDPTNGLPFLAIRGVPALTSGDRFSRRIVTCVAHWRRFLGHGDAHAPFPPGGRPSGSARVRSLRRPARQPPVPPVPKSRTCVRAGHLPGVGERRPSTSLRWGHPMGTLRTRRVLRTPPPVQPPPHPSAAPGAARAPPLSRPLLPPDVALGWAREAPLFLAPLSRAAVVPPLPRRHRRPDREVARATWRRWTRTATRRRLPRSAGFGLSEWRAFVRICFALRR